MGSDFSSFMQQPFVSGILSLMCLFVLLLVGVIVALVYVRRRKARIQAEQAAPVTFDQTGHDMPDLGMLVETPPAPVIATPSMPVAQPIAAPARPTRKGTAVIAVNDGDASEAVEVMSILRDVMDGRLLVQMGDKTFQNINNDAEFKERFNKLMRELAQVAQRPGTPAAPPSEPTAVEPAAQEAEAPTPLASLVNEPPPPSTPKYTPPPPPMADGRMPGDLPSYRLEDNPLQERKRGQKMEVKPVQEVNIAGAIEAYLQYKIQRTPEYAGRSLHIYPSPDGGVSIEVDGKFYDAVGDVADADARAFIAGAIQEWQERH